MCNGVRIEEHNNRAGLVVLKPHVRPQPFVPGSARGKNCNEFGNLHYCLKSWGSEATPSATHSFNGSYTINYIP